MSLSIITPHYNDLEGLQRIYSCLQGQTNEDWEWVVIDDLSESNILNDIQVWFIKINDKRVKLICNSLKTNASVCRNNGAFAALNDSLVFLDADDYITSDFVENRQVEVSDFMVFKNSAMDDKYQGVITLPKIPDNYLNYFLKAQFIWPITAIMWQRQFFNEIGGFHSKLSRLQDVELSIRALQKSAKYKVLDNPVDFYYRVKPIRERKNFVKPVCESVYLFISELLDTSTLNKNQLLLIPNYYYLCVKYLVRSGSKQGTNLVLQNLNLFYKKRYLSIGNYIIGYLSLKLFKYKILSNSMFLRMNRFAFKTKNN